MTIRQATPADIERLVDLSMEVQDLHVANMSGFFKPVEREYLAAYFEDMLATPAARAYVACEDEEPVGYVLLLIRERLETPLTRGQRWLYIEQIGVTAAHRERGHATGLIETARGFAREAGIDRIELDTWGFNERAQAFFRAMGFTPRTIRMEMEV